MAKPKILWMSQSPNVRTGYGIITREILERLYALDKYDILCQGWQEPLIKDNPKYPYQSVGSALVPYRLVGTGCDEKADSHEDRHGKKNFTELEEYFKPDIVVCFADIYFFQWICKHPARKNFHLAGYYPIDGIPIPPVFIDAIRNFDTPIAYSIFGQKATAEYIKVDPPMIYHGIDFPFWSADIPVSDRKEFKKQLFGDPDVFVFGMVARNQPRKNIPAFIESYMEHYKTHPKSRLLLHMSNVDSGWNIKQLLAEFRVNPDLVHITNTGVTPKNSISRENLRKIYATMDVHVNTATGEGFGIPTVESMACGLPNLITGYSTAPELVKNNNAGELIGIANFFVENGSHIRRAMISCRHLVQLMNKCAEDPAWVRKHGANARRAAVKFDWTNMIPQWEKLIDHMYIESQKAKDAVEYREI
jgi:glycosyltransferase involved in cell wall biosynthesis